MPQTEPLMLTRLCAAAKEGEAGNTVCENYERGAANGAFDLWQALSLQHLDAMTRASYAPDFTRLYELVTPKRSST